MKEPKPPTCLECGNAASLVDGRTVYPHRPDLADLPFWLCACGAYTGCHFPGKHPKGQPAGAETRRARRAAHAAFDPMWKEAVELDGMSPGRARGKAYKWLADQLGITGKACHIGHMDAKTAWRTAAICGAVERTK